MRTTSELGGLLLRPLLMPNLKKSLNALAFLPRGGTPRGGGHMCGSCSWVQPGNPTTAFPPLLQFRLRQVMLATTISCMWLM